jgi:hypothetical protein
MESVLIVPFIMVVVYSVGEGGAGLGVLVG